MSPHPRALRLLLAAGVASTTLALRISAARESHPKLAKTVVVSSEVMLALAVVFLLLFCFGRSVGRQSPTKWKAAASLWPRRLPAPLKLERGKLVNRQGLKLRRFSVRAEKPVGACVLLHGYGQSAHFEFLTPKAPGGLHTCWEDSILKELVDSGISVYAIDLQGHGESEGARGLRGFFEHFDDLAHDALQLHDEVASELGGELPIYWLGTSMGGAVAMRAAQMRPGCMAGLVVLAPMVSLEKVSQKSIFGPIKNKHLKPVAFALSWLLPTLPLIKKSESVLHQQIDAEFRADVTNYTGSVRIRVGYNFDLLCRAFLERGGPKSLERVSCGSLLTVHANADTLTEPAGSVELYERADCARKTLVLISGPDGEPGLFRSSVDGVERDGAQRSTHGRTKASHAAHAAHDALSKLQGLNMWHSITTEPGCELVNQAVARWMVEEATNPAARPGSSPVRRRASSPAKAKRA